MPLFEPQLSSLSLAQETFWAQFGHVVTKNMLLIVNFLAVLTGLLLMSGGIYIKATHVDFMSELTDGTTTSAILVGLLIVVVSSLGCVGAAREKGVVLKTYFVLLTVLVILEIGVGVGASSKVGELEMTIEESWRHSASQINNRVFDSEKLDQNLLYQVQKVFNCCGLENVTDSPIPQNCSSIEPEWDTGCADKIHTTIAGNLELVAGIGIGLGLVELCSLLFSAILFARIARKERHGDSLMSDSWRINKNRVQYGNQDYQYAQDLN